MRKKHLWLDSLARSLRKPRLRRVLAAYLGFIMSEHAHWIAILIWAYELGGVRGASAMALVQLVPAMLLASPVAAVLARLPRTRALTIGYLAQAATFIAVGTAIVADAPVAGRGGPVGADGGRGDPDQAGPPRDPSGDLRDHR